MSLQRQRATVLVIFLIVSILTGLGLNTAFAWIGHSGDHRQDISGVTQSEQQVPVVGY